jgi:large subunit ribosomal protein L6
MKLPKLEKKVDLPEGIEVSIDKGLITMKGPKGEVSKIVRFPKINLEKQDSSIVIFAENASLNQKRMIGTFSAHIKNMVTGALEGYVYKLKICSGHFPMKVAVEGNEVVVNNFLGEKVPRRSKIVEGIKVEINKDIIIVEGSDKEDTAQTAANIEQATKIRNRDKRVFQDGCYITEKAGVQV